MVNTIFLEHAVHNNRVKLFLKFEYDRQTVELAKALAGIKWSHTHKGWYLDYHPELIPLVQQTFVPQGIQLNFINKLEDVKQSTPDKKPGHALPDLNKVQRKK